MKRTLLALLAAAVLAGCDETHTIVVDRSAVHRDCGKNGPAISAMTVDFWYRDELKNSGNIGAVLFGSPYLGTLVTCRNGATVLVP